MATNLLINTTNKFIPNLGIDRTCWRWCSEQTLIHQTNVATQSLFIAAIALASLVLNHTILQFREEILQYSSINEGVLDTIYTASATFAFYLLAIFLIYNALLN